MAAHEQWLWINKLPLWATGPFVRTALQPLGWQLVRVDKRVGERSARVSFESAAAAEAALTLARTWGVFLAFVQLEVDVWLPRQQVDCPRGSSQGSASSTTAGNSDSDLEGSEATEASSPAASPGAVHSHDQTAEDDISPVRFPTMLHRVRELGRGGQYGRRLEDMPLGEDKDISPVRSSLVRSRVHGLGLGHQSHTPTAPMNYEPVSPGSRPPCKEDGISPGGSPLRLTEQRQPGEDGSIGQGACSVSSAFKLRGPQPHHQQEQSFSTASTTTPCGLPQPPANSSAERRIPSPLTFQPSASSSSSSCAISSAGPPPPQTLEQGLRQPCLLLPLESRSSASRPKEDDGDLSQVALPRSGCAEEGGPDQRSQRLQDQMSIFPPQPQEVEVDIAHIDPFVMPQQMPDRRAGRHPALPELDCSPQGARPLREVGDILQIGRASEDGEISPIRRLLQGPVEMLARMRLSENLDEDISPVGSTASEGFLALLHIEVLSPEEEALILMGIDQDISPIRRSPRV